MSTYLDISTSSLDFYTSSYSIPGGNNTVVTYNAINQLYYASFDSSSGTIIESSSYDNYLESSFTSQSRYLSSEGVLYTIPVDMIGMNIEPNSFTLGQFDYYIEDEYNYIEQDYFYNGDVVIDNGEGLLVSSLSGDTVGNIIYTHGQIIITDPTFTALYLEEPDQQMTWKSNQPIYTYNYNIKVSDYEFNYTFNPTAQTGSIVYEYSGSYYVQPSGILADNVTGSYFQPYITAVGLYNDADELLAVAKLAQPLPKPANTELTIQIKLDI
jgi:hypothetical protein